MEMMSKSTTLLDLVDEAEPVVEVGLVHSAKIRLIGVRWGSENHGIERVNILPLYPSLQIRYPFERATANPLLWCESNVIRTSCCASRFLKARASSTLEVDEELAEDDSNDGPDPKLNPCLTKRANIFVGGCGGSPTFFGNSDCSSGEVDVAFEVVEPAVTVAAAFLAEVAEKTLCVPVAELKCGDIADE